jgi:hypothetical protein
MNSSESLKKVGLVGAVAVIACLGLQECRDKKVSGPSFESGDFEKEVKTVRRGLRRGFEDLIDEESDEEYTVQVDLDENGEIPENFNYVAAIRDCVESTGKYRCFDAVWGSDTTCYNQNAQGGMVPVSISNMFLVLEDFKGKEEFVRVDAGNAINLMSTQVDKKMYPLFRET